jgi:hypothetical protein
MEHELIEGEEGRRGPGRSRAGAAFCLAAELRRQQLEARIQSHHDMRTLGSGRPADAVRKVRRALPAQNRLLCHLLPGPVDGIQEGKFA